MAASSSSSPCAACKFLRRKCTEDCVFAPYFPADQPKRFADVHKVFGASNVAKILQEMDIAHREDAVQSLVYEAEARVRDPVYGCVWQISQMQQRLKRLKMNFEQSKNLLASMVGPDAMSQMLRSIYDSCSSSPPMLSPDMLSPAMLHQYKLLEQQQQQEVGAYVMQKWLQQSERQHQLKMQQLQMQQLQMQQLQMQQLQMQQPHQGSGSDAGGCGQLVTRERQQQQHPLVIRERQQQQQPLVIRERQQQQQQLVIRERQQQQQPLVIRERQQQQQQLVIRERQQQQPLVIRERQQQQPLVIRDGTAELDQNVAATLQVREEQEIFQMSYAQTHLQAKLELEVMHKQQREAELMRLLHQQQLMEEARVRGIGGEGPSRTTAELSPLLPLGTDFHAMNPYHVQQQHQLQQQPQQPLPMLHQPQHQPQLTLQEQQQPLTVLHQPQHQPQLTLQEQQPPLTMLHQPQHQPQLPQHEQQQEIQDMQLFPYHNLHPLDPQNGSG